MRHNLIRRQHVAIAVGNIVTDAFGLICFLFLFALPWRLAAAIVLMAADKQGRAKHMLKSSAKSMCNAVGYGFSRIRSFEAAISSSCRKSLFYSAQFQFEQLEESCVDIVHHLDDLCSEEDSKFSKSTCSPNVSSAMAFIVAALRVRFDFCAFAQRCDFT
jgi:hypothetical protein